jgi:TPR repeat protein
MSRQKTKASEGASPQMSNGKLVLLALLAGAVGSGVTWSLLPPRREPPPPVPAAMPETEAPPSVAQLSPEQAALQLGHWHYDRQRWAEAAQQYETALRLGLDNPDVRTDLGNCYRFLGQPEKAREQYERSQRQNPAHENSLFNLAALYAQTFRDRPKAQELLTEYLRRYPNSDGAPRARQLLAEVGENKLTPHEERLLRDLTTGNPAPAK